MLKMLRQACSGNLEKEIKRSGFVEMDIINLVGNLKKEDGATDTFNISQKMGIEIRYVPFS